MPDTWRVLEDPAPGDAAAGPDPGPQAAPESASGRPGWILLVAGIAIVVVAAIWLLASGPSGTAVAVNAARDPQPLVGGSGGPGGSPRPFTSNAASPAAALIVEVNGAVRRPGIYRMAAGARIGDAIAAAGGYGGRVDTTAAESLNLAARLEDGQQIHVPLRGEGARAPYGDPAAVIGGGNASAPGGAAAPSGPVNVNTATSAQLEALPGIGPATAAKIIAARTSAPFASVDELKERKVVGAATLDKIRDLVVTH